MSGCLRVAVVTLACAAAGAADVAAQVRPPVLTSVKPYGLQRGQSATFVVEGANLEGADRVLFSDDGLSATLGEYVPLGADVRVRMPGETGAIIQDRAQKGRLTLTVTAAPGTALGRQGFRLHTPLGTTSFMAIWIGDEPETAEAEPNDDRSVAPLLPTPVTVNAQFDAEGDTDCYRVVASPGHDFVARVVAVPVGSQADTMLSILDDEGHELAASDDALGTRDSLAVVRPTRKMTLTVIVTEANAAGGGRNHYRLTLGAVPVLTSAFPLGRPRGGSGVVSVTGANLGAAAVAKLGPPESGRPSLAPLRPVGLKREPVNRLEVSLGRYPEVQEIEQNDTPAGAQAVASPVTINGRVQSRRGKADADLYRVRLRKGQTVVAQVAAQRLGSALDSVLEVLDSQGRAVPRARLRAVWETTIDLRDHRSMDTGMRLLAWNELGRGDFVYVDRELVRVQELPKGPDEDVFFVGFRGRRLGFEETTPEGHALLRPVYKVEVHPPGAVLPPNGLPVFDLLYRNDDGGPMLGKDSKVTFTAPQTGTYFVRLTDSRGTSSAQHAYRLTIAPREPDFDLFLTPSNPNVPRGGRVPVTVFAWRRDGFDGPIEVGIERLPPGLSATRGRILPGESSVVLTIEAATDAEGAIAPLRATGTAEIGGSVVRHDARADEKVSVVSAGLPPDVRVTSVTPDVLELAPGQRARVTAAIERANGFTGRVPLSVNNLPFRITVPDIGLNGILITEDQTSRSFDIVADERATPAEQTLFITARVETNGGTSSEHSSRPITIRIVGTATRGNQAAPAVETRR